MKHNYQIGPFSFTLTIPSSVPIPANFQLFEVEKSVSGAYEYTLRTVSSLPEPRGDLIARREDLAVFSENGYERRYLGIWGQDGAYACAVESENQTEILVLDRDLDDLKYDTVFVSLFSLEKHVLKEDALILHCAYICWNKEAILFSAPSETGKTTQAGLWEKYLHTRTVNGDRSLLSKKDGRWQAGGWPVCGSSEVCHNETMPIRAIVMLSQSKENRVTRLDPMQAFTEIFPQITLNRWNAEATTHGMDLIEDLIAGVPVYHLGCTISKEAVQCLKAELEN